MKKNIIIISLLNLGFLTSCSMLNGQKKDPTETMVKKPVRNRPIGNNSDRLNTTNPTSDSHNDSATPGRTVNGMMEPDVTGLPNKRDLLESNNIQPKLNTPFLVPPSPMTALPEIP